MNVESKLILMLVNQKNLQLAKKNYQWSKILIKCKVHGKLVKILHLTLMYLNFVE